MLGIVIFFNVVEIIAAAVIESVIYRSYMLWPPILCLCFFIITLVSDRYCNCKNATTAEERAKQWFDREHFFRHVMYYLYSLVVFSQMVLVMIIIVKTYSVEDIPTNSCLEASKDLPNEMTPFTMKGVEYANRQSCREAQRNLFGTYFFRLLLLYAIKILFIIAVNDWRRQPTINTGRVIDTFEKEKEKLEQQKLNAFDGDDEDPDSGGAPF